MGCTPTGFAIFCYLGMCNILSCLCLQKTIHSPGPKGPCFPVCSPDAVWLLRPILRRTGPQATTLHHSWQRLSRHRL